MSDAAVHSEYADGSEDGRPPPLTKRYSATTSTTIVVDDYLRSKLKLPGQGIRTTLKTLLLHEFDDRASCRQISELTGLDSSVTETTRLDSTYMMQLETLESSATYLTELEFSSTCPSLLLFQPK